MKKSKMEFMEWIEIPRVDNIKLTRQIFDSLQNQMLTQTLDGSLCLTSHHLLFSPKSSQKDEEIWVWFRMFKIVSILYFYSNCWNKIKILHSMIDALETKIRETKNQLLLKCKNFQTFLIDFNNTSTCLSINKSLDLLSNLSINELTRNFEFGLFLFRAKEKCKS